MVSIGSIIRLERVRELDQPKQFAYDVTFRPGDPPTFEFLRSCAGEQSKFFETGCSGEAVGAFTVRSSEGLWIIQKEFVRAGNSSKAGKNFALLPKDMVKQLNKLVTKKLED